MRRKLLVIFVAMATLDAVGKTVERYQPAIQLIQRVAARAGVSFRVRQPGDLEGNFDIYRNSTRHLVTRQDLYAPYFDETQDLFKYSPTFALLFAPFSYLPWGIALICWQVISVLTLFYALTRLLDPRDANLALGIVTLEVWRSIQNAESNVLVAGLMILTYVALEQRKHLRAALFLVLGVFIKIFPLAVGAMALPNRSRWRMAALTAGCLVVAGALPLLFIGPSQFAIQHQSWFRIELRDARQDWFSLMALVHLTPGLGAIPNWLMQINGIVIVLLPIMLRWERWNERWFRLQVLASILIFVVLFNPQSEHATYVIAFSGLAIWYVTSSRTLLDTTLLVTALVVLPITSILIPGHWLRTYPVTVARLALPCTVIWIVIQTRLLGRGASPVAATES